MFIIFKKTPKINNKVISLYEYWMDVLSKKNNFLKLFFSIILTLINFIIHIFLKDGFVIISLSLLLIFTFEFLLYIYSLMFRFHISDLIYTIYYFILINISFNCKYIEYIIIFIIGMFLFNFPIYRTSKFHTLKVITLNQNKNDGTHYLKKQKLISELKTIKEKGLNKNELEIINKLISIIYEDKKYEIITQLNDSINFSIPYLNIFYFKNNIDNTDIQAKNKAFILIEKELSFLLKNETEDDEFTILKNIILSKDENHVI